MKALERIAGMLDYDQSTGALTWRVKPSRGVKAGAPAGYLKKEGYRCVKQAGDVEYAHRLAWLITTGQTPPDEIDHRNGIKHDNAWPNLRDGTKGLNRENVHAARSDSNSRLIGAMQNRQAFMARIQVRGRMIYLGTFPTALEAHEVYLAAKRKHHEGNTL